MGGDHRGYGHQALSRLLGRDLFLESVGMKKIAENRTRDGQLACSFHEPWLGPHPICQVHTAAICGVPISEVSLPDFSHLAPKRLTAGEPEWSLT